MVGASSFFEIMHINDITQNWILICNRQRYNVNIQKYQGVKKIPLLACTQNAKMAFQNLQQIYLTKKTLILRCNSDESYVCAKLTCKNIVKL